VKNFILLQDRNTIGKLESKVQRQTSFKKQQQKAFLLLESFFLF
jgi:hypothetical protein